MRKPKAISRRQFVASAMSVAALSSIAVPEVFGKRCQNCFIGERQDVQTSL